MQQKGSVKEYNIAFDKLTMQMSDLPERFEKHYYLKGLRKEIRQLIESNKDNLDDMMTLKAACLRQDSISNPSLGNKKVGDDAGGTTALNTSSNGERYKGKRFKGKKKEYGDATKVKCHVCMKMGHYSWDCPKVQDFIEAERAKNWKTKGNGNKMESSSVTPSSSNATITPAKTAIAKVRALIIHPNRYERLSMEEVEDPVIDLGTTQHMTHDRKFLVDYTPTVKDVFVANDHAIKAIGKGRMEATTSKRKRVSFKDVLHVPDLAHTLLSVSTMNDNGVDVTFKASGKVLLSEDDGVILAEGYRKDDLYYLSLHDHMNSEGDSTQAIACAISTSPTIDKYTLWHRRMGHLSSKGLAKLPSLVEGIGEGETAISTPPICEACIYGRQSRLPFADSSETNNYDILELVHSDVCGPMHIPSSGRSEERRVGKE